MYMFGNHSERPVCTSARIALQCANFNFLLFILCCIFSFFEKTFMLSFWLLIVSYFISAVALVCGLFAVVVSICTAAWKSLLVAIWSIILTTVVFLLLYVVAIIVSFTIFA